MPAPQPLLHATPASLRVAEARTLTRRGHIRAATRVVVTLRRDPAFGRLPPGDRAQVLALDCECLLARGDLDAALDAARLLDPLSRGTGGAEAHALHARAELAAALGDAELAVEHYLAAGATDDPDVVPWRAGAALVMLRLGRRREALDLARAHQSLTADGLAYERAGALRTLAITDPAGGALLRLLEAKQLLVDTQAERLRAQIDTDLAGLLVLDGDVRAAVELLRSAERYAAREDLWPLQSRVRRLLERLGETPRRMEAEALAALTAGERRVTLLALEGLTNREIAAHLLVSVKAVEGHLSKVYRKLGVGSRTALSACVQVPA